MATSKRNTISLILALALVGGAWAAEPNSPRKTPAPLSNTRYASCIVNITADPEIVPLSPQAVMHLMESSAVEAKAARDQLGIDEASIRQIFPAMIFESLAGSSQRGGSPSRFGNRGPVSGFDRGSGVFDANQGSGPQSTPPGRGGLESVTFRVGVTLPNDVKPAAEEFIKAIVENLRASLQNAHVQYLKETYLQLKMMRDQRDKTQRELEEMMALRTDMAVIRQLERFDTLVDMSKLTPETSFGEAIDMLRKSVSPPLNITVLWRNIEEEDAITRDTPIQMDGLPSANLKTVLELLLKAVYSGTGTSPLTYRCEGQVITIGTVGMLGGPRLESEQVLVPIDMLRSRRYDLDNQARQVEMNLATADARRQAIEEQIARLQKETAVKLEGDTVTQELQAIIKMNADALQNMQNMYVGGRISESELTKAKESLARTRIDLARRKEELAKAGGAGQLDNYSAQIGEIAVQTAQDKAKLGILRQRLSETERQMAQASTVDSRAQRVDSIQQLIHALDQRIDELHTRQMNAQPPAVTVIGAN
jgi:hypothetical protein